MHSYRASWLFCFEPTGWNFRQLRDFTDASIAQHATTANRRKRRIIGNRRLRKDDILYYIQTRPGDCTTSKRSSATTKRFSPLTFFDKTATRVLTENGPRGGVNIIFEVKELPIIRDLTFRGSEKRAGIGRAQGVSRAPRRCVEREHLRPGQGPQRDARDQGTALRRRTSERDRRRTHRRSFRYVARDHFRHQRR